MASADSRRSRRRSSALQEEPGQPLELPASGFFVASTLPLDWPAVLSVRCGFHHLYSLNTNQSQSKTPEPSERPESSLVHDMGPDSELIEDKPFNKCMINPNSKFHMVYSIISIAVLFCDLTIMPYTLAWDLDVKGWLRTSTILSSVFWSVDILVTFVTGRYYGEDLQMDFHSVARSYLRSSFVLDLAVASSDWVSFIIGEIQNGSNASRGIKMFRFMKLGRLLRLISALRVLRVVRILEDLADRILTEGYRVLLHLASLFAIILWVAHLLTCLWFAIGKFGPSDTGARWTESVSVEVDGETVRYLQTAPLYQYTVAFHWAAGQVALGSLDIMPTNSLERIVFVLAMMVGFLFGSTLVAMMSASLMDYTEARKDRTLKMRTLRLYLRQSGVELGVAMAVQKQAVQRLAQRTDLEERDVPVLSLLSTALRSQLRFEIQRPHLLRHAVFRLWTSMDERWMMRTCMEAVSFTHLSPKDELFVAGAQANAAYHLVEGELVYVQDPDSSPVRAETRTTITQGSWFCEAALWTEWTHVGRAEGARSCTLLEVGAETLIECLDMGRAIKGVAVEYSKTFHKRVVAARPPHARFPTDLEVPYTDYCDLVAGMAKDAQVAIGNDALRQLTKSRWPSKAMDKLAEEVLAATSILVVTAEGSIMRVVSLVALRLERANQMILVQIGKWDGSQLEADCRLPGLKQGHDESVGEAVTRMLDERLLLSAEGVDIESITRETTVRMSKETGVQTQYLRSVCRAALVGNQQALDFPVLRPRTRIYVSQGSASSTLGSAALRFLAPTAAGAASREEDGGLLQALLATEVFEVPSGRDTALYAWLPPETFELLSSGSAASDQVFKAWLEELPSPGGPEASREVSCVPEDDETSMAI